MNGNIIFIILFNIILIISSIYLKKYIKWIYPLVFILLLNVLITLKYNIEGFDIYSEQPDMNNLLKLNTSLDKLIALFKRNRQDCEGRFESLGCSKKCGFGKEEKYYQIYKQRGEKGYPCPYVEGKMITEDCIDRYCKIGESCTENDDCQNNNCIDGLCATEYECGEGEYLQYCDEDGCKALDEKHRSTGARYIWDGYNKCNYQGSINNNPIKSDINDCSCNANCKIGNPGEKPNRQVKDYRCNIPKNLNINSIEEYCSKCNDIIFKDCRNNEDRSNDIVTKSDNWCWQENGKVTSGPNSYERCSPKDDEGSNTNPGSNSIWKNYTLEEAYSMVLVNEMIEQKCDKNNNSSLKWTIYTPETTPSPTKTYSRLPNSSESSSEAKTPNSPTGAEDLPGDPLQPSTNSQPSTNPSPPLIQSSTTTPIIQSTTTTIPIIQSTTTIPIIQSTTTTIPIIQSTTTIPIIQSTTTTPIIQSTTTTPIIQSTTTTPIQSTTTPIIQSTTTPIIQSTTTTPTISNNGIEGDEYNSLIDDIYSDFINNNIDTTSDIVKLINNDNQVNDNQVNDVYVLSNFFEGLKKFNLYFSNKLEATIVICAMLGNFIVESDSFKAVNEYSSQQDVDNCNVPYTPTNWTSLDADGNLINLPTEFMEEGELMPCSCGGHNDYFNESYNGGTNWTNDPAHRKMGKKDICKINFDTNITTPPVEGYNYPVKCVPNTKTAGCCFWGRGAVQLTGQYNYKQFQNYVNDKLGKNKDFCKHPDELVKKEYVWLSAIWFFYTYVQENPPEDGDKNEVLKSEYISTLNTYSELINSENSNADNLGYLISQTPPSFISAVSSSINMGKWDNSAEHIEVRVTNALKLLNKLGIFKHMDEPDYSIQTTNPGPTVEPNNEKCCGTFEEKCDSSGSCKKNSAIRCILGGPGRTCSDTSKWQCANCK